jgi:acyl-CoA synthetase (AMP-forming)/AMP-acid ligase II
MPEVSTHLVASEVLALSQERGSREVWVNDVGAVTWAEFGASVEMVHQRCLNNRVRHDSVVEIVVEERLGFLASVLGAAAARVVVAPIRERDESASLLRSYVEVDWRVTESNIEPVRKGTTTASARQLLDKLRGRRHPGLILATGGTTGTPKLVLHDLASLLATIPVKNGKPRRLLPLMRFDHIGGLDMAWRALGSGHVLVAPPEHITPDRVAAAIELHKVEVLPATPSFLNLLLIAEAHKTRDLTSLRTIPFGAEPMPAPLLERLRLALPQVDFVQRFGTSETGTLPVRSVGKGMMLDDGSNRFAWKIVAHELWVRSPSQALGYLSGDIGGFRSDGWYRTGDLAETLSDGSLHILGRRTEIINVGGEKVMPCEVESALLRHPMIVDCRVDSKPNALLGQVVAVDVVWRGEEQDTIAVKRNIHEFARDKLAPHKLPAFVKLVKVIGSSPTFKKLRRSDP